MMDASPVLVAEDGTVSNKPGNLIQIACHNSILYLFVPFPNVPLFFCTISEKAS
jgi:hypothetical protein